MLQARSRFQSGVSDNNDTTIAISVTQLHPRPTVLGNNIQADHVYEELQQQSANLVSPKEPNQERRNIEKSRGREEEKNTEQVNREVTSGRDARDAEAGQDERQQRHE